MPVIGITGGVASGKSAFARRLARHLNAPAFDTDQCARKLLSTDAEVADLVRDAFGAAVFAPDGAIVRGRLRQMIFGDAGKRRALEGILHPRIRQAWLGWVEEHLQIAPDAALLVEIPLLYETHAESLFDRVIVVACPLGTQLRRLAEHRHIPGGIAEGMIASQLDLSTKLRLCHHVIWNDATEACLDAQALLCAGYLQAALPPPLSPSP